MFTAPPIHSSKVNSWHAGRNTTERTCCPISMSRDPLHCHQWCGGTPTVHRLLQDYIFETLLWYPRGHLTRHDMEKGKCLNWRGGGGEESILVSFLHFFANQELPKVWRSCIYSPPDLSPQICTVHLDSLSGFSCFLSAFYSHRLQKLAFSLSL